MSGAEDGATAEPFWREHVGLVISAALSIFIVFKISAVARWNPTTARGILATSGTTNVLIGSALTSLPTLFVFLWMAVRPRIEARVQVRKKSAVERSAANMFLATLGVLIACIVPLGIVLVMLLGGVAYRSVVWFVLPKLKVRAETDGLVSSFESGAVQSAVVLWIVFFSLPVPWLPTEAIDVAGREPELGYVLARDGHDIVVLMDSPRHLERLDAQSVETALCDAEASWYLKSLPQLALVPEVDYPSCPRPDP